MAKESVCCLRNLQSQCWSTVCEALLELPCATGGGISGGCSASSVVGLRDVVVGLLATAVSWRRRAMVSILERVAKTRCAAR